MYAISMKPPLASATAFWGRTIAPRRSLIPPPELIGQRVAIHQGAAWNTASRELASILAAEIKDFRVPIAHDGYPNGIVGTARLCAVIDLRPEGRIFPTTDLIDRFGFGLVDHADLTMVCAGGIFAFRKEALDAARALLDSPWRSRLLDSDDRDIIWVFDFITPFMQTLNCAGRSGLFQLSHAELREVRAREKRA